MPDFANMSIPSPISGLYSPLTGLQRGGGGTSLSPFAVNGVEAQIVYDAATGTFKKDAANTNFSGLFTTGGASLKTQVNSAGELVWAPHNLLLRSEEFDNASWGRTAITVTANAATAPDGTTTADKLIATAVTSTHFVSQIVAMGAVPHTVGAYMKSAEYTTGSIFITQSGNTGALFDLTNGTVVSVTGTGNTAAISDAGGGWYFCSVTNNGSADIFDAIRIGPADGARATFAGDDVSGIYIWGAHLYRSDLGGMADNPDQPAGFESYVPTTSAAVYMGRTDHHRYSGSAWVNKGILLESEARTNLLLNSGTLATQDVTVSAVQYALSFTGTGTVTLSGASTAGPLVGTGTGENNRVSLVFTPTAGTLTCTVSGTVSNAQLEAVTAANPYPSSYIPTAGATVTRAAENLQIDAARMPAYTDAVSIYMRGEMSYGDDDSVVLGIQWQADSDNFILLLVPDLGGIRTGQITFRQEAVNVRDEVLTAIDYLTPGQNVPFAIASRHGSTFINGAVDGAALTANTTPTALADLSAADFDIGNFFNGTISEIRVFVGDVGDTGIAEVTA